MQAGFVVQPRLMIQIVIAHVRQKATGLLGLANRRQRMHHPTVFPLADCLSGIDAVFEHQELHFVVGQPRIRELHRLERFRGGGDQLPLFIDGLILRNADVEGVGGSRFDAVGESPEASGPHPRILIEEEADLLDALEELRHPHK